ncbi:hypothetical protein XarbCFBP7629_09295 [Xanthomonas arboricola]|nr:hypothetical protein XarbCFBP7629_09295 [Xanthomonas arboricola]
MSRLLWHCFPEPPRTVAGPYAAWMPRKSLHGRTCGVSRDGARARTRRDGRCAWLQAVHDVHWPDHLCVRPAPHHLPIASRAAGRLQHAT